MRELKFRAWDGKEMHHERFCEYLSGYGCMFHEFTKPEAIMQYTGLVDKNGAEIYEGDLLAFEAWEWYRPKVVEKDYIFSVEYSESGEWVGAGICTEWSTYCEVVGNIYENPELLEPQNDQGH